MKPENRSLKNAEVIVSLVLQIGVTLSSVIIFIGIVYFLPATIVYPPRSWALTTATTPPQVMGSLTTSLQ